MGFSVRSITRAITNATNNTFKSERFHKADMKALASQVKKIENSNNIMKMGNQISQNRAELLGKGIQFMIQTLGSQHSGMSVKKMDVLVKLSTQLQSITVPENNIESQAEINSQREMKNIRENDLIKDLNSGNTPGLGKIFDFNSHRYDAQ